jgi:glucokinase
MRLGIDYGGTNLKMGTFTEEGKELRFQEERLEELRQEGNLIEAILTRIREFVGDATVSRGGFASKGLVNTSSGRIEEDIGAGSLLAGIPLRDLLSKTFGAPFCIENDARAYAWGEWKFGAGVGSSVMVCMTLGTGLGCAVVANGNPYVGSDPVGGLLGGHISIDRHGEPCPCGNRGCLERYCSATALHAAVRLRHPELAGQPGDLLENFFSTAAAQGGTCAATLEEFTEALAIGIVNVIHAYGPDTIVLGGGLMQSHSAFLPRVRELVRRMAWTFPRGHTRLAMSALGNRAAALGAAFHPLLQ